jgi:CheY-like chemotaxis protein
MQKRSILWVDDDPDDLYLMRQVLSTSDYDFFVKEAHNGKEAIEYLKSFDDKSSLPCLIILDMNMPIMDGRETLKQIKEDDTLKDVPVVVFTTSKSEMDKAYCKRFGTEMITKPITYKSLEEIINRLLSFCKINSRL